MGNDLTHPQASANAEAWECANPVTLFKEIVMTFQEACQRAMDASRRYHCTQHVNAVVELVKGEPEIVGFKVSDWYISEATVKSYNEGTVQ